MNRIERCLQSLRKSDRKALVGYIVNGDPRPQVTQAVLQSMVNKGVDIIELGIPFSDPMAEGPIIQFGHERALAHGVSLGDTIDAVADFRRYDQHTPLVLMGYTNPIERMGYATFADKSAAAGVDGVIIVDLPPDEATELNTELKRVGINIIFLLAPNTTPARIKEIVSIASGFIYYVALKGVTGAGHLDTDAVREKLTEIRRYTDLPICVGFGIKDAVSARAVAKYTDGVIVGSVLVSEIGMLASDSVEVIATAVGDIVQGIRKSLDQ
jgi:tryptophan synthase alpha chain